VSGAVGFESGLGRYLAGSIQQSRLADPSDQGASEGHAPSRLRYEDRDRFGSCQPVPRSCDGQHAEPVTRLEEIAAEVDSQRLGTGLGGSASNGSLRMRLNETHRLAIECSRSIESVLHKGLLLWQAIDTLPWSNQASLTLVLERPSGSRHPSSARSRFPLPTWVGTSPTPD
jgi:hypothetical protein